MVVARTKLTTFVVRLVLFQAAILLVSCSRSEVAKNPEENWSGPGKDRVLRLATTTSVQDSGLLDHLLPIFEKESGIRVEPIVGGTGQALTVARNGDVDLVLVHSPKDEMRFVEDGFGIERVSVMENDFWLVGPIENPADIRPTDGIIVAFEKIAKSKATFVSRGDNSGTHRREVAIWEKAGVDFKGDWRIETGSGQGASLRVASERSAYALTDNGTYLSLQKELSLVALLTKDSELRNLYSVVVVNPEKVDGANVDAARKFAKFLTSDETKKEIAQFGKEKFGQSLFRPIEN